MDPHSDILDLEPYVASHLSEKASLAVRAHLEGCEECQLRRTDIALEVQWKGPERRSEPRVRVNFPGRLKLLDPITSVGPPHDVAVVEISRNGLKARTPRFLVPKTQVQIRFNNRGTLGEVRYCIRTEAGYHAGVKLLKDFPHP